MKVFVAGATGALGKQLVPQLVAAGHDVVGMTRSPAKADQVRALGARPAIADALDPDAVAAAVAEAEPEVIVHQLTALGDGPFDLRHIDRYFAVTNRLRTEGTDHLSRPVGPSARSGSWPRATRAGRPSAPAGRSRTRTTRSTPIRPSGCARCSTPSATSSRP